LEVLEFDEESRKAGFEIEDCTVCIEKLLLSQDIYRMPICKHIFHKECVETWFSSKNQEREQRCPLCNDISDITVLRELKGEREEK